MIRVLSKILVVSPHPTTTASVIKTSILLLLIHRISSNQGRLHKQLADLLHLGIVALYKRVLLMFRLSLSTKRISIEHLASKFATAMYRRVSVVIARFNYKTSSVLTNSHLPKPTTETKITILTSNWSKISTRKRRKSRGMKKRRQISEGCSRLIRKIN